MHKHPMSHTGDCRDGTLVCVVECVVAVREGTVFLGSETANQIHQWLTNFAQAVREVDFEAGRELFAGDVISFGTVNEMLEGLDTLQSKQWQNVWGKTRGFEFDYASIRCGIDGNNGWAIALWSSQGRNAKGWFERHGRSTFIFEKREGHWVAVHSHLSLAPAPTL